MAKFWNFSQEPPVLQDFAQQAAQTMGKLHGTGHVRQRKSRTRRQIFPSSDFYPNASPAQRVAFGNGGTVKGESFARQGEASDLELVPTWVTVWVKSLTHILTHTEK